MRTTNVVVLCLGMLVFTAHGEWTDISENLLPLVPRSNWGAGGWCGMEGVGSIHVDAEGTAFAKINGNGVYATGDQGDIWKRVDNATVDGRNWGAFNICADRVTGRFAVFAVQGHSAITLDGGAAWSGITRPSDYDTMRHDGWTHGAVDWSVDTPKVFIAKQHETPHLWVSTDGGQRWNPLGVDSWHFGMADSGVLLCGLRLGPGIMRSTDTGATWDTVATYRVRGSTPVRYEGRLYWTAEEGLLYSDDRGLTWHVLSDAVRKVMYGPYFGANDSEMVVVGIEGVYRTTDRGQTWTWLTDYAYPPISPGCRHVDTSFALDGKSIHSSFGWDYRRQILYSVITTSWVHMLRLGESGVRPTHGGSATATLSAPAPVRRIRVVDGMPVVHGTHSLSGRSITKTTVADQVTIENSR